MRGVLISGLAVMLMLAFAAPLVCASYATDNTENTAENSEQVGALENKFNQLVQRLADAQGEIDRLATDVNNLWGNIAGLQIATTGATIIAIVALLGFALPRLYKKPELKRLTKLFGPAAGLLGLKKKEPEREAPQDESVEKA